MNDLTDTIRGDAQSPSGHARVVAALLIMAALCALMRLHTYAEPLERDITSYALIGAEMAQYRGLYSDLWDNKPPGIHVTYMLGAMIARGANLTQVYIVNVLGAVLVLLGIYVAASRSGMGRASGLLAAGSWTIVSMNLELQANQPNTELFINALLVWMFAILQTNRGELLAWRFVIIAGLLAAGSTLYKHVAVFPSAGLAIAYALNGKGRWLRAVTMGAIIAGAWLLVWGYFAIGGRSHDFVDAVFRFNMLHAKPMTEILAQMIQPRRLVWICLAVLPAAVGLIAFGRSSQFKLMIGYALGTLLAVAMPGHWFYHYYQLWLPLLCISLGWTYALIDQRRRWLAILAVAVIILPVLLQQLAMFRVPPRNWSVIKYGQSVVYPYQCAVELSRTLKPNETFFLFGDDTGFYWVSARRPLTSAVFHYPITQPPTAKRMTKQVLADLKLAKPDVMIFGRWFQNTAMAEDRSWYRKHPIYHWARQHYRRLPVSDPQGFYEYFVRRGSDLDVRLSQNN